MFPPFRCVMRAFQCLCQSVSTFSSHFPWMQFKFFNFDGGSTLPSVAPSRVFPASKSQSDCILREWPPFWCLMLISNKHLKLKKKNTLIWLYKCFTLTPLEGVKLSCGLCKLPFHYNNIIVKQTILQEALLRVLSTSSPKIRCNISNRWYAWTITVICPRTVMELNWKPS